MNSRYERSTDVLYRLTAIYYENKRYARYPRFKVWKHTYGYFHTLEGAEELMRQQVDKRKSFAEDDIGFHYYGFMIDEIPFGQKLGSIYDVRRRVSDKLREKLERGYAKVQNELKS